MSIHANFSGPCFYCSSHTGPIQADHWVPRSRGGSNAKWNLVPACTLCNQDKSDMTPVEWITLRVESGQSWPPVWSHDDCKEAWDWHHTCVEVGRVAAERNRKWPVDWKCQVDEGYGPCGGKHHMGGMCKKHYRRWLKYGNIYRGGKSDQQLRLEAAVRWERNQIMKMITSIDDIHSQAIRENVIWDTAQGCIIIENGKHCGKIFANVKLRYCIAHLRRYQRTGNPSEIGHGGNYGRIGWSTQEIMEYADGCSNGFTVKELAKHLDIPPKTAWFRVNAAFKYNHIAKVGWGVYARLDQP